MADTLSWTCCDLCDSRNDVRAVDLDNRALLLCLLCRMSLDVEA